MAEAADPLLTWQANRYNALRIENILAGSPLDVSAWTWTAQLRPKVDGAPVITLDVDMSEAAAADGGAVTVSVQAAAVADLADQVWSLGVDVTVNGNGPSQIVKTNTVRFVEPVEPA